MHVFITGGSGYLGRPTVRALVRHGVRVTALARAESADRVLLELGATPVRGTLGDLAVLRDAAAAADGVIHLAAQEGPDAAAADLAAALAVQEGLGDRGAYVHTGGSWVYGDTSGVVGEEAPKSPPQLTAWRLDNEKRVLAAAEHGGRPVLIMPGLVYGNGGGIPHALFAEPARARGAVPLIGDGTNHWALVHVEDVADLYVRALRGAPGSAYLGVSDQNAAVADVVRAISAAVGRPGGVERLSASEAEERMAPYTEALLLDQRLTAARARRELGWSPAHPDPLADLAAGA